MRTHVQPWSGISSPVLFGVIEMPPLWVDPSLDNVELSPAAIHGWAFVAALVNLAFVCLVIFFS